MLGLISDTHDNVPNILKAVEIFKENNVELVIHLGDVIAPGTVQFFDGLNMHFLRGNCDGDIEMLKVKVKEINGKFYSDVMKLNLDGKKIVAIHGKNKVLLNELIRSQKYDYVLHGHTHEKRDDKIGKTRVINPGAHYYTTKVKTIALLDLEKDTVEFIEI